MLSGTDPVQLQERIFAPLVSSLKGRLGLG